MRQRSVIDVGLSLLTALLCALPATLTALPAGSPPVPSIPAPASAVFRLPELRPWPPAVAPTVPAGFRVEVFADGLDNPRALLALPNGDVLVSQARTERMDGMTDDIVAALTARGVFGKSANSIVLLRPTARGIKKYTLLEGLNQPFGMLWRAPYLYVANTDSLVRYRFEPGQRRIRSAPEKLLPIPSRPQNNHWTRTVIESADRTRLLVTVGAATNIDEASRDPPDRAAIWEVSPDGTGKRLYATGLRNPTGLAIDPSTGDLWTTVNERDGLGEDTPPDYLTRVVEGQFYGWPWCYFGTYPDPFHAKQSPAQVADCVSRARVPDLALGGHSVPLGLLFYCGSSFPARYRAGAFVARRGGGSRVRYLGFDVVFVPFRDGSPTGAVEPFLGGFVAAPDQPVIYGRPVWLTELADGSMLVSDDAGNRIWRVSYGDPPP